MSNIRSALWEINHPGDLLCVAVDVSDLDSARRRLEPFDGHPLGAIKGGHELYESVGPDGVYGLGEEFGRRVFRDGKPYDIPNTVGAAAAASVKRGAALFNVPAASGRASLLKAAENKGTAAFIVVTVLTTMDDHDCWEIHGDAVQPTVTKFTQLARAASADGIVCSALDLEWLDTTGLSAVTPGIRFAGHETHDQKRVATPGLAAELGSALVVMGRDLSTLDDYNRACDQIAPWT